MLWFGPRSSLFDILALYAAAMQMLKKHYIERFCRGLLGENWMVDRMDILGI